MKEISFNSLVGIHQLSGVDFEYYEGANAIRFVLGNKIYVGVENEDDGYRSSLDYFIEVDGPPVKNIFSPLEVLVRESGASDEDVLQLFDTKNGKLVLEVGTKNTDDYYPWFEGKFYVENLSANEAI